MGQLVASRNQLAERIRSILETSLNTNRNQGVGTVACRLPTDLLVLLGPVSTTRTSRLTGRSRRRPLYLPNVPCVLVVPVLLYVKFNVVSLVTGTLYAAPVELAVHLHGVQRLSLPILRRYKLNLTLQFQSSACSMGKR